MMMPSKQQGRDGVQGCNHNWHNQKADLDFQERDMGVLPSCFGTTSAPWPSRYCLPEGTLHPGEMGEGHPQLRMPAAAAFKAPRTQTLLRDAEAWL